MAKHKLSKEMSKRFSDKIAKVRREHPELTAKQAAGRAAGILELDKIRK